MGQVDPQPTSYPSAVTAGAMIAAYQIVTGHDIVSQTSWSMPLAQAEKAEGWAYNNNVGNITTYGSSDWYYNPHVTNGLKFVSYPSLLDGCVAFMKWLNRSGALAAADNGDAAAYAAALQSFNYLGTNGDYQTYANNIVAGARSYANLVPVPYAGEFSTGQVLLLTGSALFLAWLAAATMSPSLLPPSLRLSPRSLRYA